MQILKVFSCAKVKNKEIQMSHTKKISKNVSCSYRYILVFVDNKTTKPFSSYIVEDVF